MRAVTADERRARIGELHRLDHRFRTDQVVAIADDLVALHSSDPATVYLSVAARMQAPRASAVDAALYTDRSLVRHHAMRRTLWVSTPALVAAFHAATNRRIVATERKRLIDILLTNGVTDEPETWIDEASRELLAAIDEAREITTRQIGRELPHLVVPLSMQGATLKGHARVLLLLGFDGCILRTRPIGSWVSSQYAWSTPSRWLGAPLTDLTERDARRVVLDAYLRRFGPATMADMAWWTGWTVGAVRTALDDAGGVQVALDGGPGWVAASDVGPGTTESWVALLPGLDPTTMGWKDREWYISQEMSQRLFDRNGNAGPTVWMDGRVVGGWVQSRTGRILYELIDPAARTRIDEVDAEARSLEHFFGDTRHKVRFPSPMVRELSTRE